MPFYAGTLICIVIMFIIMLFWLVSIYTNKWLINILRQCSIFIIKCFVVLVVIALVLLSFALLLYRVFDLHWFG